MDQAENQNEDAKEPGSKKPLVLSFNPVGKQLLLEDLKAEYILMRDAYANRPPEKAKPGDDMEAEEPKTKDPRVVPVEAMDRVGRKSGTHLIKLVSARADGEHAVLRVSRGSQNEHPKVIPSVNAADIGIAKIVYRPLEIKDHPTKSLVDHILNPDDISDTVYAAFVAAFSEEHLDVLRKALMAPLSVGKLSAGEFPIIFVPRPGGGDLQITPVSPAPSFMDMKSVMSPYFLKQPKEEGAARVPRGKWHKRAISSKPQNISGAIGGPRCSFLAEMPAVMRKLDAEIYRFIKGGNFPRWNEPEIDTWVLRYADLLDNHEKFNNEDTRAGIDRLADRLIRDARAFAGEILSEACIVAKNNGIDPDTLASPPRASVIIFRRYWPNGSSDRAKKVLNCAHFDYRERQTEEAH